MSSVSSRILSVITNSILVRIGEVLAVGAMPALFMLVVADSVPICIDKAFTGGLCLLWLLSLGGESGKASGCT